MQGGTSLQQIRDKLVSAVAYDVGTHLCVCCACVVQVGLAAARAAVSLSPSDPQLHHELSYLEAEAELWGAVRRYDDPAIYKALETYAKRMEVRGDSGGGGVCVGGGGGAGGGHRSQVL